MLIPVGEVDQYGVIKDVKPHLLPLNAWSDAKNVRFRDRKIVKLRGQKEIYEPPSVAPYWLMNIELGTGTNAWIYAGLQKVYVVSVATHTEITRAAGNYAATEDLLWNGGILQGVPILNNGVDVPQSWAHPLSVANDLVNLANWPADHRCRVIRPFKSYLFAMDMTEAGVRFKDRVRISHPADPGSVPTSWDDTSPTTDAIKKTLTDQYQGKVVDGLGLGDVFVAYKDKSTHIFQFIGGRFKWANREIFSASGLLAKNCVAAFDEGRMHFVLTGEDVIVHNIQQRTSVIDKREMKWLNANLSTSRFNRSFVVPNLHEGEVWAFLPLTGSEWPNLAMIWNKQGNTITFRDVDLASYADLGIVDEDVSASDVWDNDTEVWDADFTTWDQFTHPVFVRRITQAKPTATKIFHLEVTEQFNGTSFEAFVERSGIAAYGVDGRGNVESDASMWKLVRSIYPRAKGGPIEVQLGTQDAVESPITWHPAEVFIPGQERPCVDFEAPACRLWGVRFKTLEDTTWEVEGYDAEVEPLGRY